MNGYGEFVADQPADRSTIHITRAATAVKMTIENHTRQSLQASVLDSAHRQLYSWEDLPSQGSCTNNVEVFPMKKVRVLIEERNTGADENQPDPEPQPEPQPDGVIGPVPNHI